MLFFDVECRVCRRTFQTRIEEQKRCPRCIDADRQARRPDHQRSVCIERKVLQTFPNVRIMNLPRKQSAWKTGNEATAGTRSFSMVFRGKDLDPASTGFWNGRVDLFADRPYGAHDLVAIDVMQATHARGPDQVETRTYLRLRQRPLLAQLYSDDYPELGLIWIVREGASVEDEQALWTANISIDQERLCGSLLITPTRVAELCGPMQEERQP